jgi:hypothetical protein
MFMVSCFGLSQASVHRPVGGRNDAHALPEAVGFLTLGRLRQSAGACNAKISTSGKKDFASEPNRAILHPQIRQTCPKQAGEFERH